MKVYVSVKRFRWKLLAEQTYMDQEIDLRHHQQKREPKGVQKRGLATNIGTLSVNVSIP